MHNLNVEEAIQNKIKTKFQIKKKLEELITYGKSNEKTEMQEKVNNATTSEDAVKVIQEFEEIIKNKRAT